MQTLELKCVLVFERDIGCSCYDAPDGWVSLEIIFRQADEYLDDEHRLDAIQALTEEFLNAP